MFNNEHAIKIFRALGDENRLKIIELLQNGTKCGCVLLNKLDIGQPTLSHHMKILCESGLVCGNKCGKWIYYSLNEECGMSAARFLARATRLEDDSENTDNELCCIEGI